MAQYEVQKTLSGWGVWKKETPASGQNYKTLKRGYCKSKEDAQLIADKLNNKVKTIKKQN